MCSASVSSSRLTSVDKTSTQAPEQNPQQNKAQFYRVLKIVLPILAVLGALLLLPPLASIPLSIAIGIGAFLLHQKQPEPTKATEQPQKKQNAALPSFSQPDKVCILQSAPNASVKALLKPKPAAQKPSTKLPPLNQSPSLSAPNASASEALQNSNNVCKRSIELPPLTHCQARNIFSPNCNMIALNTVTTTKDAQSHISCPNKYLPKAIIEYLQKTKIIDNIATYKIDNLLGTTVIFEAISHPNQHKATISEIKTTLCEETRDRAGEEEEENLNSRRIFSKYSIYRILLTARYSNDCMTVLCEDYSDAIDLIDTYASPKGVLDLVTYQIDQREDCRYNLSFKLKSNLSPKTNIRDIAKLMDPDK
jgi:hypothetical protein